jgi:hypothetical protein
MGDSDAHDKCSKIPNFSPRLTRSSHGMRRWADPSNVSLTMRSASSA